MKRERQGQQKNRPKPGDISAAAADAEKPAKPVAKDIVQVQPRAKKTPAQGKKKATRARAATKTPVAQNKPQPGPLTQTSNPKQSARATSQALSKNVDDTDLLGKENTILQEFFTSQEDAAINRFADAGALFAESYSNSAKAAYLSCMLGDEEYGIDLHLTREILRPVDVTPVPHAPFGVIGVMSLRGQVMPVIDLAQRLGLGRELAATQRGQRYVVLNFEGETLCLRVDAVDGVVSLDEEGIEPPPKRLSGRERDFVFGIGRSGDDHMVLLLDLDAVVGDLLPREA